MRLRRRGKGRGWACSAPLLGVMGAARGGAALSGGVATLAREKRRLRRPCSARGRCAWRRGVMPVRPHRRGVGAAMG